MASEQPSTMYNAGETPRSLLSESRWLRIAGYAIGGAAAAMAVVGVYNITHKIAHESNDSSSYVVHDPYDVEKILGGASLTVAVGAFGLFLTREANIIEAQAFTLQRIQAEQVNTEWVTDKLGDVAFQVAMISDTVDEIAAQVVPDPASDWRSYSYYM